MGRAINFIVLLIHSLSQHSDAFAPVTNLPSALTLARHSATLVTTTHVPSRNNIIALAAKRRRRKDTSSSSPDTDELPDFDISEDEPAETIVSEIKTEQPKTKPPSPPAISKPANPTPIKRGSGLNAQLAEELGGNVDGLDEDLIVSTMRGRGETWQPPRSIQDTLSDRSLEKFMDFDKMIAKDGGGAEVVELPTMEEVIARRKKREAAEAVQEGRIEDAAMLIDTTGMSKKAAKRAQRSAERMERERLEAEEAARFKWEEVNVLKLLENGAWVGIGLLVVWEIYINSPFFERAAPLIPVVYESTPGM